VRLEGEYPEGIGWLGSKRIVKLYYPFIIIYMLLLYYIPSGN
jgi:hypothetical protein